MKALIRIAALLMAMAVAGCGGSSSTTPKTIAFLYVVGQGSNNIFGFDERSDGSLSSFSTPPFAASPIPMALALHTSKNFVYVANSTSNTVSGFNLNHATGILTPVGTAVPPSIVGANPISVGVDSGGQFLFVLNQGSANISVFSIDPTRGFLTEIAGSPFPAPANSQFMVVSPTAAFLYVAGGTSGLISAFSIAANGALSTVAGSPFPAVPATGGNVLGMAMDSKGQFLFAVDKTNNNVVSFSIQSSGALAVPGSSFPTGGTSPAMVAVDSTGKFLYTANHGSNDVSAFTISSGALAAVAGSPFPTAGSGVVTPTQPSFLTVDPTNAFLYVADQGSRDIAAFSINASSGALTAVTNSPFLQSTAPTFLLSTR
jgi:6-phosphogluconolactonase